MSKDFNHIYEFRKDFPILNRKVYNQPLVYLDNAATTQKPLCVIEAEKEYYLNDNANIHRGVHYLSRVITEKYEEVRKAVKNHVNARFTEEIIFTSGTTDSINLVANGLAQTVLKKGDEVLITCMEHHSNILPWQEACRKTGAVLKVVDIFDNGELNLESFSSQLSDKTKVVAVTHVSNTLGTINPVKFIIDHAHIAGSLVLVDGAQAVPHFKPDVQDLEADFYAFSSHKMYGPTGLGVLYGKREILNTLPPYKLGGGIIKTVSFDKTVYEESPQKFEAGTPPIAQVMGLGEALKYMAKVGWENALNHENKLLKLATEQLVEIEGLKILGTSAEKSAVISFSVNGIHPLDIGTLLDHMGIAVRTGHHCTQPLLARLGHEGAVRASFAWYNTEEEVMLFSKSLKKVISMLV